MYMGLYRADGDVQRVADFLVILIREKNLQDVLFPGGQLIVIGKVEAVSYTHLTLPTT